MLLTSSVAVQSNVQPGPNFPKEITDRYLLIQDRIETYLCSIAKYFIIIGSLKQFSDRAELFCKGWKSRLIDVGDAQLVSDAREHGIDHIISDDSDIVRVNGIILCSCNPSVINAAKQGGMLLEGK